MMKAWEEVRCKKIKTDTIATIITNLEKTFKHKEDLVKELKARGKELTIEEILICFKDMENWARSEEHSEMYWLIFYTLEELDKAIKPKEKLLKLYNKYIMKVLT